MTSKKVLDVEQLEEFERLVQSPVQGVEIFEYDFGTLDLDGVDLAGAVIYDSVMDQISARGARFSTGQLIATSLLSADLSGAQLIKSLIHNCACRSASFTGAAMFRAEILSCDLAGADFSATALSRTSFFGCDLTGAKFTDAVLDRMSFSRSRLAGADLTGVTGTVDDDEVDVGVDEPRIVSGEALLQWMRSAGAGPIELSPDLSSRKRAT